MAELVREQHGLVGLRVGYRERSRSDPMLICVLDSPNHESQSWEIPAAAINLPTAGARLGQRFDDAVNLQPIVALLATAPAVVDLRADRQPLWLNLTGEHPLLPAIDWEGGLSSLALPVLRLPVHLAAPAPAPSRPRVALWLTMPVAKAWYTASDMVEGALQGIREALGGLPEVHLFADAALTAEMSGRFGGQITVHDPTAGPPSTTQSAGGLEAQPWPGWIIRALHGRSLDVLHLIGHGYLSVDQGAFACAEAPNENFDEASARFLWPQQLASLLTTVGAWGAVFTAVPGNYSTAALRLLATRTAALRAAATALHDSERIGPSDGLAAVYRLLLAHPAEPPASTNGLAITTHPARLGIPQVQARARRRQTELSNLVEAEADVPGWMVAAQRQIDQWEAQLSFSSTAPRVDSTRAGLELAKSRLDSLLRDTREESTGKPATGATGEDGAQ